MNEVRTTNVFDEWVDKIKDSRAVKMIAQRLRRFAEGNMGDVKAVAEGVFEARIFYGPGYRLYYTRRNGEIIVMLCGGDKSAQQKDIEKAIEMAKEL